jgi:hypothetical protein
MASKEITYKEHSFQPSYEIVNPAQAKTLLVCMDGEVTKRS